MAYVVACVFIWHHSDVINQALHFVVVKAKRWLVAVNLLV